MADRLPNVDYFDTWNTFAAADGGYSAFYRDGDEGHARSARHDGVHFNTDGYALLVEKAAQLATRRLQPRPEDLRLLNAAPEPSGDRRHVGQVPEGVLLGRRVELDLRQPPCR